MPKQCDFWWTEVSFLTIYYFFYVGSSFSSTNTEQRLKILTKSEHEELYSIPQFDLLKRQKNFTLCEEELEVLNKVKLFNS